jgi:threonine dehydratase
LSEHRPVSREDIRTAAERIAPHVRRTPVIELAAGTFGVDRPLSLKLELLQHTGSFKPRGAFNRILSSAVPPAGVIAASGGNHGIATAHAARCLGHRAEIFVPEIAARVKIERLRGLGADVRIVGASYAEALAASMARAHETGALIVHAYDQPETVAGQGTVALEWDGQGERPTTVLVAVGGGGLMAGVAAWWQQGVRVVAVEPQRCPTLARALEAGTPVDVDVGGLAADSLGARRIGSIAFAVARECIDRVVLVEDDAIREAQRALWNELRVVAEPGGAAALAALTSGALRPDVDERVGVLVCGGNADLTNLA